MEEYGIKKDTQHTKTNKKEAAVNPALSVIILNVNGLNILIKR